MAPRKQTKQAAAESTVAAADGNVTPPKKRKTVARSTVAEAPKQAKSKAAAAAPRHTKQAKKLLEEELAPVFSPKKLRSRDKNVVAAAVTTKNAAPKTDTRTKSKKVFVNKQQREKADEEVVEQQVAEKKTRGKSAKKAGTKPKAKAPVARKRKSEVEENEDVENAEVVGEEIPPVRRTTRRGKTVDEENVAPAATRAQRPRKRAETKMLAEADDTPEEKENDAEMIAAGKKPRERTKKTDTKIGKL